MKQVVMMMISSSTENPTNDPISEQPITTSTCPTWKLYENPFYISQHHLHNHHQHQQRQYQTDRPQIHRLRLAASLWDLTFFRPVMDSELDYARAQIAELKAELEFERKVRKKVDSMNRKLVRELFEERKGREALERVCEELAKEISSDKGEMNRMRREMEKERKMLRMAEVLREERVQMKLTEAKILLEEKLLELEVTKQMHIETPVIPKTEKKNLEHHNARGIATASTNSVSSGSLSRESSTNRLVLSCNHNNGAVSSLVIHRRASPEAENPHIKRGIKGFVEFSRVVRAIGSKSRHLGTKLECQKAQLRILLKQKNPNRSNPIILS